jgi:hypothetical protein
MPASIEGEFLPFRATGFGSLPTFIPFVASGFRLRHGLSCSPETIFRRFRRPSAPLIMFPAAVWAGV